MALSTFADLKTELTNQGFDYLTSTQQGDYINTAYQEVCGLAAWPFLEASSTSHTSGTSISDIRQVLYVRDPTADRVLKASDARSLIDWYGSLSDTGDPEFWYFDGQTTIKTYPVNASRQLTVSYIKFPADLSGTDQPVIPLRYRMVIVDGAACFAHLENGDYEAEQARRAVWQRRVDLMSQALLGRNNSTSPDEVVSSETRNW